MNKLHEIEPTVGKSPLTHAGGWLHQVIHSRCHMGHSLAHSHALLLKGILYPECIGCQSILTLKHVLLDFVELLALYQQLYTAANVENTLLKENKKRF